MCLLKMVFRVLRLDSAVAGPWQVCHLAQLEVKITIVHTEILVNKAYYSYMHDCLYHSLISTKLLQLTMKLASFGRVIKGLIK